jgi:hypothetical protein
MTLIAAAALGGERHVPSSYSTIQAAVNAAASGDVVVVAPGTYTEAVTATKSGITITGSSTAILDGKTDTDAITCINLTGNGNVVNGFTFKNGIDHVILTGDDCKVKNAISKDAAGSFCKITGPRGRVEKCKVERPKKPAVLCKGSAIIVVDVDVDVCADIGIDVEGDDCEITSCRVNDCDKGGHRARGDGCKVKYCEAWTCKPWGFRCEGDNGNHYGNYAEDCGGEGGSGFCFDGHYNTAKYCDAWACWPHGHHWKGNNNWCYDNWADYCDDDGFRCEGSDNDWDYCRAQDNGRDGYGCEGDRNRHYGCESYGNYDDGFDCDGGYDNEYRYCKGKYNERAGCENGGNDTDVYYCTFLYNDIDIGLSVSTASFDLFSLNLFASGSIITILGIGLGL